MTYNDFAGIKPRMRHSLPVEANVKSFRKVSCEFDFEYKQ